MSDRDGVIELPKRKGKRWWRARLYWIDERTGKSCERRATYQADSKALALLEREARLAKAKEGTAVLKSERKRFREVAREWVESIDVAATRAVAQAAERKLNAHFGEWWIDAVTTRAMQDYLDALTIRSVANVRNALVNIFRIAVRRRYVAENLAKLTETPRRKADPTLALEEPKPRALTPEQTAAYFDDLERNEPQLYVLVFVQFCVGCRFSEITALRWDDVDLEAGTMKIWRGHFRGQPGLNKGKRARTAGLPMEARGLIRRHRAEMEHEQWPGWQELVFPRPVSGHKRPHDYWASTTIDKAIKRSFARVGIDIAGSTHAARHTMITISDEIGASEAVLRRVVGHRSKKVHEGYKHARDARVIDLAEAVGRALKSGGSTGTKTGTSGPANNGDA